MAKSDANGTVAIPRSVWRGVCAFLGLTGVAMLGLGCWVLATQYDQGQSIVRIEAKLDHVKAHVEGMEKKLDRLGAGNLALLP